MLFFFLVVNELKDLDNMNVEPAVNVVINEVIVDLQIPDASIVELGATHQFIDASIGTNRLHTAATTAART